MSAYVAAKGNRHFVTVQSLSRQAYTLPKPEVVTYGTPGNGTFTVPENVTQLEVEVQGAGGSGGATWEYHGDWGAAAGGGAGAYARGTVQVQAGQSFQVVVGAGGAAVGGIATGNRGGTSSFGTFISCTGGSGGNAGRGPNHAEPGAGGVATVNGAVIQEQANGAAGTGNWARKDNSWKAGGVSRTGNYGNGGHGVPNGQTSGAGQGGCVIVRYEIPGGYRGYRETWALHTPMKGTL